MFVRRRITLTFCKGSYEKHLRNLLICAAQLVEDHYPRLHFVFEVSRSDRFYATFAQLSSWDDLLDDLEALTEEEEREKLDRELYEQEIQKDIDAHHANQKRLETLRANKALAQVARREQTIVERREERAKRGVSGVKRPGFVIPGESEE